MDYNLHFTHLGKLGRYMVKPLIKFVIKKSVPHLVIYYSFSRKLYLHLPKNITQKEIVSLMFRGIITEITNSIHEYPFQQQSKQFE